MITRRGLRNIRNILHGDSQKCLSVVYVLHVNQMFLHVRKHETPRLRFKHVHVVRHFFMYSYYYLTCCWRENFRLRLKSSCWAQGQVRLCGAGSRGRLRRPEARLPNALHGRQPQQGRLERSATLERPPNSRQPTQEGRLVAFFFRLSQQLAAIEASRVYSGFQE